MTDMYEKKSSEKSEKVAKNELQRLKNIARAKKVKIPRVGLPVTADKASATQVGSFYSMSLKDYHYRCMEFRTKSSNDQLGPNFIFYRLLSLLIKSV